MENPEKEWKNVYSPVMKLHNKLDCMSGNLNLFGFVNLPNSFEAEKPTTHHDFIRGSPPRTWQRSRSQSLDVSASQTFWGKTENSREFRHFFMKNVQALKDMERWSIEINTQSWDIPMILGGEWEDSA